MDGDGSSFTYSSSSDYSKGLDATDISWADIFLDGIHSDDTGTAEVLGISSDTSGLGASIHGRAQQLLHQPQRGVLEGQLQIHIPTHLQGSLTSNAVQQASTNLCGTVAYLTPSASSQQQVSTTAGLQNVLAGQHQITSAVGQHQSNAKLVQIASSFPMASVQQLTNSVPIQTLLQPNQTLTAQTIYGGQGTGLFPAQGSVHIENPKVVNVNFGPHVIGSDGSGQQAIIQTAEGKRVLITNSQLQHIPQCLVPQSISLTQPLVGTQLINSAGGGMIRTSMVPGTHTIMPASSTGAPQIVLPSGQTVIPRQANTTQDGIAKNVVLRPLTSNMSPVIYQSGHGGQLIHSQPTLITSSGAGLQVVNTGGSQGGQVQLIAQPSINQAGIGQQQLSQGTIMNLINNQSVVPSSGNQIAGLMHGQNIFVNGQMLNISQLGGLTVPQLQVQHNPQGGVTLTNINATVAQAAQFQPATQHLVIQRNGQQQQVMLQPKITQSTSVLSNTVPFQRLSIGRPSSKNAHTPTSNVSSASSTPVLTPTPSTPTSTPTPDLMSDSCDSGGKSSQGINILEQALAMSAIDLQSFEDDFNIFDNADCFPSVTTPPTSFTPAPPLSKQKLQPTKSKSKTSRSKSKMVLPVVNMPVNNNTVQFQQPSAQLQNTQGQKITISPHQKIITANGQVYVLSANGQQFVLQPSASSANSATSQLKPVVSVVSTAGNINRPTINILTTSQLQMKKFNPQPVVDQNSFSSIVGEQLKLSAYNIPVSVQHKNSHVTASAQSDSNIFIKTIPDGTGTFKIETAMQSVPPAQVMFTAVATINNSPSTISQTSSSDTLPALLETQILQGKNQTITTLSGTFLKQEPLEPMVKQEPVMELYQSASHQDLHNVASSMMNLTHTSLASTTSSTISISTPLVITSSSLFTAVTTSTTLSHQVTIMSTAQMTGSHQTYISAAGTNQPYSPAISDTSLIQPNTICQPQSSSTLLHGLTSTTSSTTSASSTTLKSNSKEKDPANIKSMIPIKIADSILMLSLTPGQKERLESQLSRMSKKDQNGLLMYQQKIIRRSQQVQQKQLEQQMKQQQLKLLQQQQLQQPQELQQIQREQIQQSQQLQQSHQQIQLPIHQSQLQFQQQQHGETNSTAIMMSNPSQIMSRSELLSGQPGAGFPTTVLACLELMDKDEHDGQHSFQSLSIMNLQEQSQQIHQIPPLQQQQIHSNLQLTTASLEHTADPGHQFTIPQIGRCLAEQQLLRDRSLALSPDVNTPFKSLSDAMRRLVRYHTLQDHKPEEGSKTMKTYFFEPINPGHFSLGYSYPSTTVKASIGETENENIGITDNNQESGAQVIEQEYYGVKGTSIDPNIVSEKSYSPSNHKRKLPDKGSTGTLKLVLKRRTTDNFIVKKSLANTKELSDKLIAAVSLEKSDSEYEFDPQAADNGCNQPFIVRRRTLSATSLQNSSDAGSDNSSLISPTDKMQDNSSMEDDDLEDERDENNEEVNNECDDEEEVEKSSIDDDNYGGDGEQFIEDKHNSKSGFRVSFGQDNAIDNNDDDSCSVSADAFMETDEIILKNEAVPHHKMSITDIPGHLLFTCDDSLHSGKKSSHRLSKNGSVTSEDVFKTSLSYPLADIPSVKVSRDYGDIYLNDNRVEHTAFSFETNANGISNSFGQSCRTSSSTQDEEYMSESSMSNMEKESGRKELSSSSLFTTPNKSLLETDAMFNSDEDDEMRGSRRLVSAFEIDNKDPQSSMINDSVRSAINSVLDGGDDDDDDDNEDSHTSWASAAQRPSSSSSSVHRNLFHSSFPHVHDTDLDAAVQSILQS